MLTMLESWTTSPV